MSHKIWSRDQTLRFLNTVIWRKQLQLWVKIRFEKTITRRFRNSPFYPEPPWRNAFDLRPVGEWWPRRVRCLAAMGISLRLLRLLHHPPQNLNVHDKMMFIGFLVYPMHRNW